MFKINLMKIFILVVIAVCIIIGLVQFKQIENFIFDYDGCEEDCIGCIEKSNYQGIGEERFDCKRRCRQRKESCKDKCTYKGCRKTCKECLKGCEQVPDYEKEECKKGCLGEHGNCIDKCE